MGVSTLKSNGIGGYIQGVEVTASIPFNRCSRMPSMVSDSSSAAPRTVFGDRINDVEIDVPGLSKEILNSTLYFEKHGFSARVSNRYRGDFLGEVPLFDATLHVQQRECRIDGRRADRVLVPRAAPWKD